MTLNRIQNEAHEIFSILMSSGVQSNLVVFLNEFYSVAYFSVFLLLILKSDSYLPKKLFLFASMKAL